MHADTVDEAQEQIVVHNGVAERDFAGFDLFIPIATRGWGAPPLVAGIWEAAADGWRPVDVSACSERSQRITAWLRERITQPERRLEKVRRCWVEWLSGREDRT
jgi:hypothetical protein